MNYYPSSPSPSPTPSSYHGGVGLSGNSGNSSQQQSFYHPMSSPTKLNNGYMYSNNNNQQQTQQLYNSNTLKVLWNTYTQTVVYQDSLFALIEFLKYFVQTYYQESSWNSSTGGINGNNSSGLVGVGGNNGVPLSSNTMTGTSIGGGLGGANNGSNGNHNSSSSSATSSILLFLSSGTLTDITRHLSKHLVEEIGYSCTAANNSNSNSNVHSYDNSSSNNNNSAEYEIYQYLIGKSIVGEGPLLLSALDILSRQNPNGIPISFIKFLCVVLTQIFSLPNTMLYEENNILDNRSYSSNSNNKHHHTHNHHHHHYHHQIANKPFINFKSVFQPIDSFFYLSPLPSSLTDTFRDTININDDDHDIDDNNNNNNDNIDNGILQGESFMDLLNAAANNNSSNSINSSSNNTNTPNPLSISSTSILKQPKQQQQQDHHHQQQLQQQQLDISSISILGYQILKIIGNLVKEKEFFYELLTSDCLSRLINIFMIALPSSSKSNLKSISNDPSFKVVYQELIQIFSLIMSQCCLSIDTITLVHNFKLVKILLNVLDKLISVLPLELVIQISQLLIYTIKSSSRLSKSIHEDFIKNNGYSTLLKCFIYIADHGTLKHKSDFIQSSTNLLFIGTGITISNNNNNSSNSNINSSSSSGNSLPSSPMTSPMTSSSSSTSPTSTTTTTIYTEIPNIKIFEIYLNVFSITNSEETKTEILKCIRGVFYTSILEMNISSSTNPPRSASYQNLYDDNVEPSSSSSANNNNNNNNSNSNSNNNNQQPNLTTMAIFHQLEPFKILFSQFDGLCFSNRKMILDMMDVLLMKNRISILEIKFYCQLFKSKSPSTVLLVCQHLTDLLNKSKINSIVLGKECGMVQTLLEYLKVEPEKLHLLPILESTPSEISLCFSLIPSGKYFAGSGSKAKYLILYMIVSKVLDLLLELFTPAPAIQTIFVENQGLQALYSLLKNPYLIQSALKVIACIAIGGLSIESKIIQGLIEVLQMNGGVSTLDSNILTMRKSILSTMCYIFHHNNIAKNSFKNAGGFIWSVSILDGISRCVNNLNADAEPSSMTNSTSSLPNLVATLTNPVAPSSSKDSTTTPPSMVASSHEIFFFLKVLIDTLSAVMKNNPSNQDYFRREIQFSTLSSTLKACGYMKGVYATSLCDSLLNMAVSGSWPPSCQDHSLEEGSLLSLYSPITSFFPVHFSLAKHFEIHYKEPNTTDPSDSTNNLNPDKSSSSSPSMISATTPTPNTTTGNIGVSPVLSSIKNRNRSYTNESLIGRASPSKASLLSSPSIPYGGDPLLEGSPSSTSTPVSLDLASEIKPFSWLTISKIPEKSSLMLATERYICCQSCRDSLMIENPEIFKLIIILMSSEEEITATESKSSCYILKELIFLSTASLANQKRLSMLLVDIVNHFRPLLLSNTSNTTSTTTSSKNTTSTSSTTTTVPSYSTNIKRKQETLKLKPLLLELIQSLVKHNLTLLEFRKYFELLKVQEFPLDLLHLLLNVISNRGNIPLYYAELSKHGLEYIDFLSWSDKIWPPTKGFGISFWFRYSLPCLNINKSPIYLLSKEGVYGNRSCEIQLILDNNLLHYRINYSNSPSEQYCFSEFKFEPDQFYHVVISHGTHLSTITSSSGGSTSSSSTPTVGTGVSGGNVNSSTTTSNTGGTSGGGGSNSNSLNNSLNNSDRSMSISSSSSKKTPVKLYVNGCLRGQSLISYPKPQLGNFYVRFGGTNASSANQDYSTNNSWHLGNSYYFEEMPTDKEVFYLYLLGPDHFRGLKVDISAIDSILPNLDKTTKLHPLLIEHLLNPSTTPLLSLHEKILYIFTAKCLCVTTHKIANKTEAVTHSSAQAISASSATLTPQEFSLGSSLSMSRKQSLLSAHSVLMPPGSPSIMSSSSNSSFTSGSGFSTSRFSTSALVSNSNTQLESPMLSRESSMMSIASTMAMPPSPMKISQSMSPNVSVAVGPLSSTLGLNNSLTPQTISLIQTGLPYPLPTGVISQLGVKDVIMNSGGVSVIIYLVAMCEEKDYQRSSLRLLQSILHNSQRNLKDMRDISGYQIISYLIRKRNWILDDSLLSILFSFLGIQSNRTSIPHYIDGVVQDVMALKHFLLERTIWSRAAIPEQKKLFESLEKLVNALHDYHEFNIIKFRQAGAFETILKMCREQDLPLDLLPTLISILNSIIHKPPKLKEDLHILLSYLLESMPKSKKYNNNMSNSIGINNNMNNQSNSNSLTGVNSNSLPSITLNNNNNNNTNINTNTSTTGSTLSSSPNRKSRKSSILPILVLEDKDKSNTINDINNNNNSNSNDNVNQSSSSSSSSSAQKNRSKSSKFIREDLPQTSDEIIRVSILDLLLDVLSKNDVNVIEEFHSLCSLETVFGLLINDSMATRIRFLKIIDIFLHSPSISNQFQKIKGFHLLGHQLQSYKSSEQTFNILFCILFGKSTINPDNNNNNNNSNSNTTTTTSLNNNINSSDDDDDDPVSSYLNNNSNNNRSISMYFLYQDMNEMKYPGVIISILIILCNSSTKMQHMVIKIIHNIFLQNDQFKSNLLENELVPRLIDILASNFQKRSNQTFQYNYNYNMNIRNSSGDENNSNSTSDHWIVEESILSLLKEIALYGAKSQDGGTILRDILVILHLNTKMDYDYICCLQRRVLSEVITFFNENKFSSIDSLVSSYEKICVLTINTLSYQEKNMNKPTTSSNTLKKNLKFFSKSSSGTNNSSSSTSSNTLSPNLSNSKHHNSAPPSTNNSGTNIPISSSSSSLNNESTSDGPNGDISNNDLSNEESSTTDSDSPMTPHHHHHHHKSKKPFIPIWIKEGHLFDQEQFIDLLIKVLSNTKIPQSNSTYRNLFSTQYSARSLLCKLIFILLTFNEYVSYQSLVLSKLVEPAVLSEILAEEDFILVLLHITIKFMNYPSAFPTSPTPTSPFSQSPILSSSNESYDVTKNCFKLWTTIIQASLSNTETMKRVFDISTTSLATLANTTDPRDLLIRYQNQYVDNEYKKWEEKNNQSKKEWKLQYLEIQKNKQNIIIKNQDITKSTKKLSESLCQLKTEYQKTNLQYLIENRESKRFFQNQWKMLVKKVTHDKAIWNANVPLEAEEDDSSSPAAAVDSSSDESLLLDKDDNRMNKVDLSKENTHMVKWKLDPTEGPHRTRMRLKRIQPVLNNSDASKIATLVPELNSPIVGRSELQLFNNLNNQNSLDYSSFDHLQSGEKVDQVFKCSCISPFYQRDGEFLISDQNVYFLDESLTTAEKQRSVGGANNSGGGGELSSNDKANISSIKPPHRGKHITWAYEDIIEIHKRRHLLKNSAIEIFLGSGAPHKTYLFAFSKTSDRDVVYDLIMSKPLPNRVDYASEVQGNILKMSITKKWQRGLISNFEYLMHLNTLAGRSFNDLTQYPIFPFILKDYESETLDLENPDTFRDLTKPMGAQDPNRLKKFVEKFNYLCETNETPYHYGSHYSNIGSVLHFLVRLQPFSSYFIEFQGGRFDVPDRAFHSISQTWKLSSSISSSDVKELIPEFFYLPDFLINSNKFNMGTKQDGVKVDDVILPPWAKNDPRLFIKKHMEALECKYVSENLHHWIDLMFGYKQQGEAAVKAFNMFFPLTYEGAVDIDSIEDSLTRDATIAQIHSYGQTPKLLFTKPHPKKNWSKTTNLYQDSIYCKPEKLSSYLMFNQRSPIGSISIAGDSPIHLPPQRILFYPDNNKSISWGHWDQNLRINSIDTGKVLSVIEVFNDDIICCDITKNGRLFVTGGTAGTVKVWKRCNNDGTIMTRKERGDNLALWSTLYGHTNSILCITVSQEYSIIISGSKDGSCIIWDLNRLCYVNSLKHKNPVTSVQVSPTTNYISTFETSDNFNHGCLRLWNGNAQKISKKKLNDRVNCMIFTSGIEGLHTNLLITGMESGIIILWNAWTLCKIRELTPSVQHPSPITALTISKDHNQLIVGDSIGNIVCFSVRTFDVYSAIGIK